MNNLKLGMKMSLLAAILAVTAAGVAWVGLYQLGTLNAAVQDMVNRTLAKVNLANVIPGTPVTETYDFNAQVGGPIIKDKLWFFGSFRQWAANNLIAGGFNSDGSQAENTNKIDDEIIAEIRRSKFLVADFTCEPGKVRGGVYFEAGFAMALPIPVIWTCAKKSFDDIHFDTRQYNHIVWNTPKELRTLLKGRIGAVIGDGPLKGRP